MGRIVRAGYYATAVAFAMPALALAGAVLVGNWLEESIRGRSTSRDAARTETPASDEIDLRDHRPAVEQGAYPTR